MPGRGNMRCELEGMIRPMSQAIDAVLAGTKGFAVALLAPLTARIGSRPRVAGDPSQVLGLCSGPSALAVVEFMGEGSLPTIQALVRDGRGLRIVAGVPVAHAGAEGTLRALGVEVARWDGKTDGVISAVERVVAGMGSAPARPAVAPAAAAHWPARPTAPLAASAPAAPRPAAPAPPSAAKPPAGASAARPAAAPSAGARLTAPAPAAARPVAPPAPAPAGAAARPGTPAAAATPLSATKPASPAPPAAHAGRAAPRPPPAPAAQPPIQGMPQPARPLEPRAPTLATSDPAPAAPVATAAAQSSRPPANFFADLDGDVSVDVGNLAALDSPAVDFHAAGVYVPPPSAAGVDWPAGLASPAQAEDALKRALQGSADPARPLHALATRTLESLSDLELGVLVGEPQPVDAAPIRKAAVLRLRVAEALASAPPQGSKVDSAALFAILGEIDGTLAEVAPLLGAAPGELAPALESIRNSLVREAIDFSEAGQRVATPDGPAAAPRPSPSGRAVAAKVLSIDGAQDTALEKAEDRRKGIAFIALAIVVLGAIGFHVWRHASQGEVRTPPTLPGAPSNTVASTGSGNVQLVVSKTGKFDPAELERFRAQEELRGNRVEEISPGVLKVTTADEPKK